MDTPDQSQKRCSKCGEVKTLDCFIKDKRRANQYHSQCRACKNEYNKRWQKNNPEKVTAAGVRYRAAHPERVIERSRNRLRYKVPPDVKRERNRRWKRDNADWVRDYNRRWQNANPEKTKAAQNRRSARKRMLLSSFTADDWKFAVEYFHGTCAYCGNSARLFDVRWQLHQDHYIPVTANGPYTPDNILPACQSCNLNKKNKMPASWIVERFGSRKAKRILTGIQNYFETIRNRNREE